MRTSFKWFFGLTATLAAGTIITACTSSSDGGNGTSCADGGTCPSGQVCNSQGVCEDTGSGGSGGSTGGSGGSTGGSGGSTGGSGGSTGGSGGSTGGSGGSTGGSGGGGGASCDPAQGSPGTCSPNDPSDPCQTCIELNCCAEWGDCTQENPPDNCSVGGLGGEGEASCFQQCLFTAGTADETTQVNCAASCTTAPCGSISGATNALIACLNTSCFTECLQPGG